MPNYIEHAKQLQISTDDVAEWVGLHYGRSFERESMEKRTEWVERYAEAHGIQQPTTSREVSNPQAVPGHLPVELEWSITGDTPEIGVSVRGYFVTNPLYDEGQIDRVDPMEWWGVPEAQAKLIVDLNEELPEAVDDAINAVCRRLQTTAGLGDGAEVHFNDTALRNKLMEVFAEYIVAEVNDARKALSKEPVKVADDSPSPSM
uniref:Uncharacterized protein n=1 Tax=viral metagenome TaxID=1070528 RepID=A0A6H1ZIF7_9ZZZZ